MGLDTNFNQDPYFDDYDEDKDFHRVLFKPGVAVQARELTQLQTILQNQIERFGDNILKEGTIVKGCSFNYISRLPYVKIKDLQIDGQPVVMSNYTGLRAVGLTSGVEAYVLLTQAGLETQTPNLNTLFVRYVKSSGVNKTFTSTEQIRLENFTSAAVETTVVAAGTVTGEATTTIGNGVGLKISDGIIYQKGSFVAVDEQTIVVERYSIAPDNISVGFVTKETVINSFADTTLLDNAQGYNNVNAPGADRIQLTPVLTAKTTALAIADEDFFTIVEYQNGKPVRIKDTTQYSVIGEEFARRTEEESGDYVIENFPLSVKAGANSSVFDIGVGQGLAYVGGKRIQTFGTIDVQIDAGTEFESVDDQNITTNIGNYVIVDEYMGHFDFNKIVDVDLYDAAQNAFTGGAIVTSPSGNKIGEAKLRGVEHHSGTVGTNTTQYKMYLFDIRMSNSSKLFTETKHIYYNGATDGNADIVLVNSKATLNEVPFERTLWPVGLSSVKTIPTSTADFVYRTAKPTGLTVSTSGALTITLSGTDRWTYGGGATLTAAQKEEIVLICNETVTNYTKGKPIPIAGAVTTDADAKVLTIAIGGANPGAVMDVIAYYNVKKITAAPAEKVTRTAYVKVNANTAAGGNTGTYSLGFPDAYELLKVYKSDNNTFSETTSANNVDVTNNFILFPNQRDAYYDNSYVKKKSALTIGDDDVFLFKVSVFQENNSGSFGDGYFSVDSYTNIDPEDIPVYVSESGISYDLRNAVDFRPYCVNTSVIATAIGDATVSTTAVGSAVTFPDAEQYVVAPNNNMEIDYEYYLPRIDRLFLDSEGNIKVIKGVATEDPTTPAAPAKGMPLAVVKVPAYPSLTSLVANRAKKPEYAIKLIRDSVNKGYTMRDISKLDRRISQLEYYTVLNSLETETKDKEILDETGANRFKNGIVSDNFENLRFAEVTSPEFSAAIDPSYKEITPKIRQFDIDLKMLSTSNVTDFNNNFMLSKTDTSLINQTYATTTRNCVGDFYSFKGTAFISPEYDSGYDLTTAPDYNLDIDFAAPFMDFAEAINEFVPLQQVDRSVATTVATNNVAATGRGQAAFGGTSTTATRTTTQTINELQIGLGSQTTDHVGDFVTDVQFKPFMRQREIKVLVFGLRPSTTFHFFFDGDNVDTHVASASGTTLNGLRRSSVFNTAITTDASGTLKAIFRIPASTYFVGDRKLEIYDVSAYSDRSTAISSTSISYSAFNYSVSKRGVNVSTRTADVSVGTSSSQSITVTNSFQPNRPPFVDDGDESGGVGSSGDGDTEGESDDGDDPIAQSFIIKPRMVKKDNVLYATKIDLYFQTKSATAGFTLYIAEVKNGIITSRVLPLSKVHINASDVNISTDASSATTVTFPAPLTLEVGSEYAFVVKPDGNDPDYRIWIARTGGTDVLTSKKITQDVNDGVLFTSTNARSWTPHQDENIKYNLYRASFSSASGYVEFTNKESEYFTVGSTSGTFSNDEYVFVNNAVVSAQTINVTAGSTSITGTNTKFQTYLNVGGHLVVAANSTVFDVLKISAITSDTNITVEDVPKYSNTVATFFKSIVGNVSQFDNNDPAILYLDNSTASGTGATEHFNAGDVLVGAESNARATITSVDDKKVSFVAPNIYRTNTTQTKTNLSATRLFRNDTNANYARNNIEFNNYTFLNSVPTVIRSYSNERAAGITTRSFTLKATLENTSGSTPIYSSPLVDGDIASMKVFEYIINDDNAYEDTSIGSASSKYITKVVSLADSLDAEDLKVFLTAYRPPGTTIEVYAKFLSVSDSDIIGEKPWTKLIGSGTNPVSENANRFDFKEHTFNIPTSVGVTGSAFLDSDVFKYTDGNFLASNFKHFAIKVVLRSTTFHKVPRLRDLRAIALA